MGLGSVSWISNLPTATAWGPFILTLGQGMLITSHTINQSTLASQSHMGLTSFPILGFLRSSYVLPINSTFFLN